MGVLFKPSAPSASDCEQSNDVDCPDTLKCVTVTTTTDLEDPSKVVDCRNIETHPEFESIPLPPIEPPRAMVTSATNNNENIITEYVPQLLGILPGKIHKIYSFFFL